MMKFLEFCGKVFASLPWNFCTENPYSFFFVQNVFVGQPIFKIFAAHFATHEMLNCAKNISSTFEQL